MKPLKAGGEVDSWCTKCRLFLNHRIIAMLGPKPVRVECSTCGSHHNYRARAPGDKAAPAGRSAGSSSPASVRAPRVSSATKAEQARVSREQTWEKAVTGRALNDFRKYNIYETFREGDLVRHSRFGDGVVTRIIDANKIEILFKDEPRTLAQSVAKP
jgi:hypothetical protein